MTTQHHHSAIHRWISVIRGGKGEFRALATLLLVVGLLLTFGLVANEMNKGETRAFDNAILLAMRNDANPKDPIGPQWFEEAVRDVTSLGSNTVLIIIVLGTVGFLALSRARAAAVLVLVSVGGGSVLMQALKEAFARVRPDVVSHSVIELTRSFPSGHSTLAAVTYLTLGALVARVQSSRPLKTYVMSIAILLTLLVGVSRVYLGMHWPTDVLAGWCLGAAWAMLCWMWRRGCSARAVLRNESTRNPQPVPGTVVEAARSVLSPQRGIDRRRRNARVIACSGRWRRCLRALRSHPVVTCEGGDDPPAAGRGANSAGDDAECCGSDDRAFSDSSGTTTSVSRHSSSGSRNWTRQGWLEATTEYSADEGFRYRITAEGGSGPIRSRVLKAVLDGERSLIALGEAARSALAPDNYTFQPNGVDAEGLANVLLSPRRKERALLSGSMFLRPGEGELVRLQGRLAKNPSFWVRDVDIVRKYSRIHGALVPVALESRAHVRFLGPATFRMTYRYVEIDGHAVRP